MSRIQHQPAHATRRSRAGPRWYWERSGRRSCCLERRERAHPAGVPGLLRSGRCRDPRCTVGVDPRFRGLRRAQEPQEGDDFRCCPLPRGVGGTGTRWKFTQRHRPSGLAPANVLRLARQAGGLSADEPFDCRLLRVVPSRHGESRTDRCTRARTSLVWSARCHRRRSSTGETGRSRQ